MSRHLISSWDIILIIYISLIWIFLLMLSAWMFGVDRRNFVIILFIQKLFFSKFSSCECMSWLWCWLLFFCPSYVKYRLCVGVCVSVCLSVSACVSAYVHMWNLYRVYTDMSCMLMHLIWRVLCMSNLFPIYQYFLGYRFVNTNRYNLWNIYFWSSVNSYTFMILETFTVSFSIVQ